MLVGYGLQTRSGKYKFDDEAPLKALGCERLFIDPQSKRIVRGEQLEAAINFIREGDTLVVVNLDRLGNTLDEILGISAQLHKSGVLVWAEQNGIRPDDSFGSQFGPMCSALMNLARTIAMRKGPRNENSLGHRGRPKVISASDRAEIARLLKSGKATPLDIAHRFNISLSTIYRHFPLRQADRQKATGERQTNPEKGGEPSD